MADKPVQPNPGEGSFVERIVTDPNNVPDVMLLYGYTGASSEEGHERLYFGTDLAKYVEVPTDAILHRVAAAREQDPYGGMTLWVRKDAALIHKLAPGAQALAHFFAGAIQAQGAAPAAPMPENPALTFGGPVCGVTLPAFCPVATAACTRDTCGAACTVGPACNVTQNSCGVACTIGGPVCGVTLPAFCQVATAACTRDTCGIACTHPVLCQVATAACTRDTCGVACTAAGPCITRGADCPTQAATCACTEIGCPTDITPCINTHAVTCGACPSVIAACQSVAFGCQSVGADCTFIGCGHTLACTQGLLCAAPQQARAAGAAMAAAPAAPPISQLCGATVAATCQICASANVTCVNFCTQLGCITVDQDCRSPFIPCITQVQAATCNVQCTIAGPCHSPFVPCITPACTIPPAATCNALCTIFGPGCQVFTPRCPPFTPACPPITPACPPFSLACPPVTLACPQDSLACGFGQPGPGNPVAQMRAVPTMFAHCTQVCSQLPQMGCGHGCALNTVM